MINDYLKDINIWLMRNPSKRVYSTGTNVFLTEGTAQFGDYGLNCVYEFGKVMKSTLPAAPMMPVLKQDEFAYVKAYARQMAHLAKDLAEAAGNCGGSLALIRLQLIQEELAELAVAIVNGDEVEALDALGDLSYVVDGTYLSFGLGHYKIAAIQEIHSSNMTKLDENGNPIINDNGRVMKGPNYRPPNLKEVLGG